MTIPTFKNNECGFRKNTRKCSFVKIKTRNKLTKPMIGADT